MHAHAQAAFFRLPPQLRHEIYWLAPVSGLPTTEPLPSRMTPAIIVSLPCYISDVMETRPRAPPHLGVSIAASCQRMYTEIDLRPLYRENEIVTTNLS